MNSNFRLSFPIMSFQNLPIIFFNLQLKIVGDLFSKTFRNWQWMIALMAPLTKEIYDRVIDKLMTIYASKETLTEMKFVVKIHMNPERETTNAVKMVSPEEDKVIKASTTLLRMSSEKVLEVSEGGQGTY